jgi:hypothetical protein
MSVGLTRDERQKNDIVAHLCMEIRPAGVDESRHDIPNQVASFQKNQIMCGALISASSRNVIMALHGRLLT